MTTIIIAIAISFAVSFSVVLAQRRTRAQAAALSQRVLPVLQTRGPLTVPELMQSLDMRGIQAQGKLMMTLGSLAREGRVVEGDVPPGTAFRDKINVRRYGLAEVGCER